MSEGRLTRFDGQFFDWDTLPTEVPAAKAQLWMDPNKCEPTIYREPVMGPPRIEVNWPRAYQVLDSMIEALRRGSYPYNMPDARVPQEEKNMPKTLERGGVEHAMFFFISCYWMRGGIDSNNAVQRLGEFYDTNPELWDCENVVRNSSDPNSSEELMAYIAKKLKDYGLGFQNTTARGWLINAHRLYNNYGGDPRRIFDGATCYDDLVARIANSKSSGFWGFQEKMVSMLTYYYRSDGLLCPEENSYPYPVPTDFHVARVSTATEIVTFPDQLDPKMSVLSDELLATLRYVYERYATVRDISPEEICNAVWMHSRAACRYAPGNSTSQPRLAEDRDGRSTPLAPIYANPDSLTDRKAYAATCGQCPIEPYCKHNVPAANYYTHGGLVRRSARLRLPPMPVQLSMVAE